MSFTGRVMILVLLAGGLLSGCIRYSFTGVTIPSDVRTIYIPFFSDRSGSGIGDLSDQLNDAMIDRFINQSRLQLTDSPENADVIIEGTITSYSNRPFSVAGDQRADLNRVQIGVQATYKYVGSDEPEWQKNFTGNYEYDPSEDPVDGEIEAIFEAMLRLADSMFNDAMGEW
ncbi:LptE family protein [Natronogracilivirgula saccharolytica]|uniref:LptE family protein n=2 Tax=Natronogracilivirga saccharolytica TaxID=2812953 RepID=A0A8J7RP02_9BACT|nr:LptE family protein [Natronogracilivirga saccharolytica]